MEEKTMSTLTKKRTLLMASLAIALMMASPVYAIFAKLSTSLIGTSINGVTPSGNASVNQGNYPIIPGLLTIKVSKVNLPDGTVLSVNISDCPWYGAVAFLKVVDGSASLSTSLPSVCQVGRLSSITVSKNTTIYLRGGNPWKI
jgi:hypothetical protein